MIFSIKLTKAIPTSEEIPAYMHFLDAEDELVWDEFDLGKDNKMQSDVMDEELADPPIVPIPKTKHAGYNELKTLFMTDPEVDNDKVKRPTSTTDQISTHSKIDLTTENDILKKIPPFNFESSLPGNKKENLFENNNRVSFTDLDKTEDKNYGFSDFFTQLIKFCMESIGLVMDSFMGVIKTNPTGKSAEDCNIDYFYDTNPSKNHSKNIKKREITEATPSSSLQTEVTLTNKIPNETTKLENTTFGNLQETRSESVVISSENTESSVTETLTSVDFSKVSSDNTDQVKSGKQPSTLKQEETSKGSVQKQNTPLSSEFTNLGGVTKATETSALTKKVRIITPCLPSLCSNEPNCFKAKFTSILNLQRKRTIH